MSFLKSMIILMALIAVPVTLRADDINRTIYFTTKNAGNVPFEHDKHLRSLNSNCSACHNSIFHISRKLNQTATMADMEKGKSCGACHNKENPAATQLSRCTACHPIDTVPIQIPNFGTLEFSHSKHLGMYSCGDCHSGIFRTDKTNPHVSMLQMTQGASCGTCHDGKTGFSVKGDCVKCHTVAEIPLAGGSVFSHKAHLEMSFSCSDCHNKIFIAGPNRVSYSMLDMEKGKSCGACHDGKSAFSVKGDCQKCHKSVKEIQFKAFKAMFSHDVHTAMFKCNDCHSAIFVGGPRSIRYTMPEMEKGTSCGTCHDGKTAFSVKGECQKCHLETPPEKVFTIKNAGTVQFSHLKHKTKFSCGDCHNAIIATGVAVKRYSMAEMDKGGSCGACHDGKTAFSVKSCSKCHPIKDVLFSDDARFSHDRHIAAYSCSDCHNQLFIAGPGNRRVSMAEMEKGASCGACHDGSTVFSAKGDCNKCHKSTVNVVFTPKETGATTFPHSKHTAAYSCTDCHNSLFIAGKGSKRYNMADMEKGASCGTCHDGKTVFGVKNDCQKCHLVKQINFRPGSAVFSHTVHTAAYSCKDCHPGLYAPAPRNRNKHYSMTQMEQGSSCGTCHDDKSAFSVKGNCQKCHPGNLPTIRYELSAATGNVEFAHKVHIDRGYGCGDCHYGAVPSGNSAKRWVMKEMDQGKFCGTCHGFSMAFSVKDPASCERCHLKDQDWRPQQMR
ncbi:MAG TPA: cytochrome C [Desulfuromonadales bacterium]|nr:cytochrome C [Desulfuromonadales bacterium]